MHNSLNIIIMNIMLLIESEIYVNMFSHEIKISSIYMPCALNNFDMYVDVFLFSNYCLHAVFPCEIAN